MNDITIKSNRGKASGMAVGLSAWLAPFSHSDVSPHVLSSERPFLTTLFKLPLSITLPPLSLLHFSSQHLIPADYVSHVCLLSPQLEHSLRTGRQGWPVLLTTVSLYSRTVSGTIVGTQ